MQAAEMLSDLTSLQVCDPNAALALVSARPAGTEKSEDAVATPAEKDDEDLQRAKSLISLHSNVKLAHQEGIDEELEKAREAVERVLRDT